MDTGCRQLYEPPAIKANDNYLVVDGFLNAGNDSTRITLTRTRNLIDTVLTKPELSASVLIEGDGGYTNQLTDLGSGVYGAGNLNLNNNQQYRIRIATNNGSQYLSDFIPVKQTPPIDSVNWQYDSSGVNIYLNTHDPQNNTRYYKWRYEETWKYRAAYYSSYKYENGQVVYRPTSEEIFYCWRSQNSTSIITGTSSKLSEDIIYRTPIIFIPQASQKLSIKYSILVRQYAITKEAFEYWQNLKKNTEQLGSIFDAQPSEITGNIHSVNNTNEPVLGYLSISSVQQNRIFISNTQLGPWYYLPACDPEILIPNAEAYFGHGGYIPTTIVLAGVKGAVASCVDCTLQGGVTVKPLFWQ